MKIIRYISVMLIAGLMFGCKNSDTSVRILHAVPDAPAVDVYVDNRKRVSDLEYSEATTYRDINAGSRNLKINAAGTSTTVIDVTPRLKKHEDYTAIAIGNLATIEPLLLLDDNSQTDEGMVRVRAVHASPSVPEVDIYVGAPGFDLSSAMPTLSAVPFKAASDYLDIPAGDYQIIITAAGEKSAVYDSGSVGLSEFLIVTLVAIETDKGSSPVTLVGLTNLALAPQIELKDSRVDVRVIHASPDAPNVDVLYNDSVVLADVPFKAGSDYLTVMAGAQNFKVNAAGTDITVIDVTPELMGTESYTVIATDVLGNITPLLLVDDRQIMLENGAQIRVVHASPDAPAVDILVNGGVAIGDLAFGEASDNIEIGADTYSISVNVGGTDTTVLAADISLEAGNIYTVLATGFVADGSLELQIYVD